MGDRGNIAIAQKGGGYIFLYSHWGGSELPEVLSKVLSTRERWEDSAYLARMLFCEMVPVDYWDRSTGFGISTTPPDNEHGILVVDCGRQTIFIGQVGEDGHLEPFKKTTSFEEFLAMTPEARVRFQDGDP